MKMTKKSIASATMIWMSVFSTSLFTACSDNGNSGTSYNEKKSESEYRKDEAAYAADYYDAEYTEEAPGESTTHRASQHIEVKERKLIKEGWLTWRTENLAETNTRIRALSTKYKAYISAEQQYNYSTKHTQNMTIRVPSDVFDAFVTELGDGVVFFEQKNINVLDVTAEFIDVEARIKSKKEMEARYQQLLQQARTVGEMLEIERHLGNIREEIESAQARLNGMSDRVAYSTLHLEFYEKTEVQEYAEDEPGFFSELGDSFINGWNKMLNFFLRLAESWPYLLIFGIPGFLAFKRLRRWHQKRKTI
jgi:hypothetical protein